MKKVSVFEKMSIFLLMVVLICFAGQNQYGKLLEAIRLEIRNGDDMDNWVRDTCRLIEKDKLDIVMRVEKDGVEIVEDSKHFEQKNILFVGKADDMDVIAAHGR